MIGKILALFNSVAGWWYVYMHATHKFQYYEEDRWIPYLIIGGFAIMLASFGISYAQRKDNG